MPLALALLLNCSAITAAGLGQPAEVLWDVPALSAASLLERINTSELEKGTYALCLNSVSCLSLKHAHRQLESKPQLMSGSSTEPAQVSKIAAGAAASS